MIHANDTHVLIDEQGVAVLSGSLAYIEREALALVAMGYRNFEVRTIDDAGHWDWTMVDWGDD